MRLEPLEDRRLLAVVTVTTLADTVDFNDGVTSLREAIFAANLVPGADTIEFAPSLTAGGPAKILLTGGELVITEALTIDGPGADALTIDAQQQSRIFYINDGSDVNTFAVQISGLSLTGGKSYNGGAVYNDENLTLSQATITGNTATRWGGGIASFGGSLSLDHVAVSHNSAILAGGGIYSRYTTVSVAVSTITGNSSPRGAGGIDNRGGNLAIESCSITGNSCKDGVSGVASLFGNLTIASSTFSGNTGTYATIGAANDKLLIRDSIVSNNHAGDVGVVHISGGEAILSHVTFTSNWSYGSPNSAGVVAAQGSNLSVSDCVISGNERGGVSAVGGQIQITNSKIVNNGGGVGTSGALIQIEGCEITGNGGPGISAQSTVATGTIEIEHCTINNNRGGGGIILALSGGTITISNCTVSGNNTLASELSFGRYVSGGGLQVISGGSTSISNCTIVDNTAVSFGRLAFGGNESVGGIHLDEIGTATARIANCTISGNRVVDHNTNTTSYGGGISIVARGSTVGAALVDNCLIYGNSSSNGAGIYILGAAVTVSDSSICSNFAMVDGGGVYMAKLSPGELLLRNSTVSGNTAYGRGGGLYMNGAVQIDNTTLAQNYAQTGGGGFIATGSLRAANTLLASNHAGFGPDISGYLGAVINMRSCLVGNSSASGLTEAPVGLPDANGNLIGGPVHGVIDPKLGPLADNGGFALPNGSHILTMALLPGSPAINAGDLNAVAGVGGVPVNDERGTPFVRGFGGRIDIGAVESQPNPLPGDYNYNGIVDAADYVVWRHTLGSTTDLRADATGTGGVNQLDYEVWKENFGARLAGGGGARSEDRGASVVLGGKVEGEGGKVELIRIAEFPPRPLRLLRNDATALGALVAPRNDSAGDSPSLFNSSLRDAGLLVWLVEKEEFPHPVSKGEGTEVVVADENSTDLRVGAMDEVFAGLVVGV